MTQAEQIQQALEVANLPVYEVYQLGTDEVLICISFGDWKHEHLATDLLMSSLGWHKIQEIQTDGWGSDCYSSEHTYIR